MYLHVIFFSFAKPYRPVASGRRGAPRFSRYGRELVSIDQSPQQLLPLTPPGQPPSEQTQHRGIREAPTPPGKRLRRDGDGNGRGAASTPEDEPGVGIERPLRRPTLQDGFEKALFGVSLRFRGAFAIAGKTKGWIR